MNDNNQDHFENLLSGMRKCQDGVTFPLSSLEREMLLARLDSKPEIAASPPASPDFPFGGTLEEMDVTAFFNMRDWLTSAVEAKGAEKVGGGIGLGQADIDIKLEGCRYNISIRPL